MVLMVYVASYFALVERGWPGSQVITTPSDRVSVPAHYRLRAKAVAVLFAPVQTLDRRVRQSYWNPTAPEARKVFGVR
jgi:hypothetical protein